VRGMRLASRVLNCSACNRDKVGVALVSHPRSARSTFTGSVRAGREIGQDRCGAHHPADARTRRQVAHIIFEDADLGAAVAGAVRGFIANAGQVCPRRDAATGSGTRSMTR